MTLLLELMFRLCVRHSPPGCQSPLRGRLRLNCEITQISQSTCGHAPPLELPLPTLSASGGGDRYPAPKPTSAITAPRKPTSPNRRPPKPTSPNRLPQTDGRDHRTAQTDGRTNRRPRSPHRANRRPRSPHRANRRPLSPHRANRRPLSPHRANRRPRKPTSAQTDARTNRRPRSPHRGNRRPPKPQRGSTMLEQLSSTTSPNDYTRPSAACPARRAGPREDFDSTRGGVRFRQTKCLQA